MKPQKKQEKLKENLVKKRKSDSYKRIRRNLGDVLRKLSKE